MMQKYYHMEDSVVMFVGRCVRVGVWHNNNTMCVCVYACKSTVNKLQ